MPAFVNILSLGLNKPILAGDQFTSKGSVSLPQHIFFAEENSNAKGFHASIIHEKGEARHQTYSSNWKMEITIFK